MKKQQRKKSMKPTDAALNTIDTTPSITDPQGMYTGITADGDEPIQDADDL